MVITDYLERNARLYGSDSALVEINPSEERDNAVTWRDFNLIENANPDAPYRREMSWKDFDRRANRFANLLLSRGLKRGTKVAILLMNCLEVTFSSPVDTLEFSKFAGILSAALSQRPLSGFEITQLEFYHLH